MRITHPDRVLDPDSGVTKAELARCLELLGPVMLPHVEGRPLTLVRCPSGVPGQHFFQKHPRQTLPPEVHGPPMPERAEGAKPSRRRRGDEADDDEPSVVVRSASHLVTLVQFGVVEVHRRAVRTDRPDRPDVLVIDLDPGEGVTFEALRDAALGVREIMRRAGLDPRALLTGGKGIHVLAPLERRSTWEDLAEAGELAARALARLAPDRFVLSMSKAARPRRIFIDHLRNRRGATAVSPFSPRARPGLPLATPVEWSALEAAGGDGPQPLTVRGLLDAGARPAAAWDAAPPGAVRLSKGGMAELRSLAESA